MRTCVFILVLTGVATTLRAEPARHWAYVKPVRPAAPAVTQPNWVLNPIDAFVLARLEREGLPPAVEADRVALIRRVSLDLIGLPPTLAEVDAFLADHSPDAYEKLVDRLLASPRYGERWAQPWLDAARYADSNGFTNDRARTMWAYRDWVIQALNDDMPFDRFTVEQLAGDMLPVPSGVEGPNATDAQRIATGFHRNAMWNDEAGVDPEELRYVTLVERVGTTATVFLGSTLACAQCHNHKYDPFSQREFFGLLAFFETGDYEFKGENYNRRFIEPTLDTAPPEIRTRRVDLEKQIDEIRKRIAAAAKNRPSGDADQAALKDLQRRHAELSNRFPLAPVMRERSPAPPRAETVLRTKGGFLNRGGVVPAEFPAVLHAPPAGEPMNRLTLARWIVSPDNPLTARVTVNRAWAEFFGRGIVETLEDFGTQSSPPSHPELLDWLATEFAANGWSRKKLHKTIVTSATYRQDSRITSAMLERDPYNRLLARGPRVRLGAEAVRDTILATSGLLSDKIGGPSVYPPRPETTVVGDHGGVEWPESTGPDRYRRGMYTFWRRTALHPALLNFDAPTREQCNVKRARTNTPLQALTLLNDTTSVEAATALAKRARAEAGPDVRQQLEHAFRLCTSRKPTADEAAALMRAFDRATSSTGTKDGAWFVIAQSLLNLDEVLTKG